MPNRMNDDPVKYKPTVGGTDVKDTAMLTIGGGGKLTPAQNENNETVPFSTGKAKHVAGQAEASH